MKIGDIVKLYDSNRRNGKLAGHYGLIVDFDSHKQLVINVDGMVRSFHTTQIERVIGDK
jgi:hypothetical protein